MNKNIDQLKENQEEVDRVNKKGEDLKNATGSFLQMTEAISGKSKEKKKKSKWDLKIHNDKKRFQFAVKHSKKEPISETGLHLLRLTLNTNLYANNLKPNINDSYQNLCHLSFLWFLFWNQFWNNSKKKFIQF